MIFRKIRSQIGDMLALFSRSVLFASVIFFGHFLNIQETRASENCVGFSSNGINNWFPFVYRNNKGELTGTVVEGTRLALSQMNLKLSAQPDRPWKRILYDLKQGTLDIVLGAYWNSERAAKYHYSEPLDTDDVRVFVKAGSEFPLASYKDLIGRNGFKLLGGSYGDEFDTFAAKHLNTTDIRKSDDIIKMMAAGRGDYGIVGYVEGLQHIRKIGAEGKVVALPWPVLSTGVRMLINRKSACAHRVGELNALIRQMKKNGQLKQLSDQHLKHGPS